MEKLSTSIMGIGSVSLIETIPAVTANVNLDVPSLVQTIIQLIVAAATLLAMFKKKPLKTT